MTNKEMIEKLTNYFMSQDSLLVANSCAHLIIDLNRFYNFNDLSENERNDLFERVSYNLSEAVKAATSTNPSDLKLIYSPLKEEEANG